MPHKGFKFRIYPDFRLREACLPEEDVTYIIAH